MLVALPRHHNSPNELQRLPQRPLPSTNILEGHDAPAAEIAIRRSTAPDMAVARSGYCGTLHTVATCSRHQYFPGAARENHQTFGQV